jgi:hypothetical protein
MDSLGSDSSSRKPDNFVGILGRRRGRKPEEGNFEKGFWEEDGAGKTAGSTRQDQGISITPLADAVVMSSKC